MTGAEMMPVDVWVDGGSRVRRLESTYAMALPGGRGGAKTSISTAVDFFDFGVDVAVKPPPAGATFDATRLVPGSATR